MTNAGCAWVPWLQVAVGAGSSAGAFSGLYLPSPAAGPLPLQLWSPSGLLPVGITLQVVPGAAAALVALPPAGSTNNSVPGSPSTYTVTARTALTGSGPAALIVSVVDAGGNALGAADPTARVVSVSCSGATLAPYGGNLLGLPAGAGGGVAGAFYSVTCNLQHPVGCVFGQAPASVAWPALVLLAPSAGRHTLLFTTPGLAPARFPVQLQSGNVTALQVVAANARSGGAAALTSLGAITVALVDAGGNAIGARNTANWLLTATATGPRAGQSAVLRTDLGQDRGFIEPGQGDYTYPTLPTAVELELVTPAVGTYVLNVSAPGVAPALYSFRVLPGLAAGLAVAPVANSSLATVFATMRVVQVPPLQVLALDGAGNVLGAADVTPDAGTPATRLVSTGTSSTSRTLRLAGAQQLMSAGAALFSELQLLAPPAGAYTLQFTSPGMASATLAITVTAGYASAVDVCAGCANRTCTLAMPAGSFLGSAPETCRDTNQYAAAAQARASIAVRTPDAQRMAERPRDSVCGAGVPVVDAGAAPGRGRHCHRDAVQRNRQPEHIGRPERVSTRCSATGRRIPRGTCTGEACRAQPGCGQRSRGLVPAAERHQPGAGAHRVWCARPNAPHTCCPPHLSAPAARARSQ